MIESPSWSVPKCLVSGLRLLATCQQGQVKGLSVSPHLNFAGIVSLDTIPTASSPCVDRMDGEVTPESPTVLKATNNLSEAIEG